jgi:hypothetical protein
MFEIGFRAKYVNSDLEIKLAVSEIHPGRRPLITASFDAYAKYGMRWEFRHLCGVEHIWVHLSPWSSVRVPPPHPADVGKPGHGNVRFALPQESA